MPLQRRLPKRGFKSRSKQHYQVVNMADLNRCDEVNTITAQVLAEHGLIRCAFLPVKILGTGNLTQGFEVQAQAFSASATQKINQAGGKVIIRV